MDTVYIYGLVDPRNDTVFYIGFTQYLKKRFNVHLNVDGYRREKNLYKDNVIRNILSLGLKPEMIILDSCEKKYCEQQGKYKHELLEIQHIRKKREQGVKLTNLTIGGDGGRTALKKTFQYSEEGKFLEEYESVNAVAEKYGVGADIISKVIDQRSKKSYRGTYLFSSKEKAKKNIFSKIKKDNVPVLQYSANGDLIDEHVNQYVASEITKTHQSNISYCLNGKRKKAGGFIWKYKNK